MRRLSRGMLVLLFLVAGAPPADAAPSYVHAECIKCHKGREATDGETAVTVWQKSWHQKSSDDLIPGKLSASPKRKATIDKLLAANPGKKTFLTDARCISCHLTNVGKGQLGVICESCHGPGSDYKEPHQQKGGYEASVAKFGMKDTRNLKDRAVDCLGCHLASGSVKVRGISPAVINEVIAQGHPPMDSFDYTAEVQKASIFHWPKQKARANGEPAGELEAAGKAVARSFPPLPGAAARVDAPPAAPPATPTSPPAVAAVAPEAVPAVKEPAAVSGEPAAPAPTKAPRRGPTKAASGPAAGEGSVRPAVAATPVPAAVPPTPTPLPPTPPPTATAFPGPESIERLTAPEAALLLQGYVILVLNRALAEKPPEELPAAPEWRAPPMLRGESRAERLLELQRETLLLQSLALGIPLPTGTPEVPQP